MAANSEELDLTQKELYYSDVTPEYLTEIKQRDQAIILNITDADISSAQTQVLAGIVQTHPSLHSIRLNYKDTKNDGLLDLAAAVNISGKISHLEVRGTEMTDQDLADFLGELVNNRTLLRLTLTEIKCPNLGSIVAGFLDSATLPYLDLIYCTIDEEGHQALAEVLADINFLRSLEIIIDKLQAIPQYVDSLINNRSLINLRIYQDEVSTHSKLRAAEKEMFMPVLRKNHRFTGFKLTRYAHVGVDNLNTNYPDIQAILDFNRSM